MQKVGAVHSKGWLVWEIMENVVCVAQHINIGTKMRVKFQERYNLQDGMTSRATGVDKAMSSSNWIIA